MLRNVEKLQDFTISLLKHKHNESFMQAPESEALTLLKDLATYIEDLETKVDKLTIALRAESNIETENETLILNELRNAYFEIAQRQFALDQHAIVSIADAHGKIKYVNSKFVDISQFSTEELIGEDHKILNSGYHPPEFFISLYQTILAGNIWHGEIRNKAKDGSYYWVETTIVPLKNYLGEIDQFISIRTEITKQKEAELSIRNLLAEKEMLLTEVHHRIKNNLTSVYSLLKIQADFSTESDSETLNDAARRVQTMQVLYDKLYRSNYLNQILLNDYIPTLLSKILESFPNLVNCEFHAEQEIFLSPETVAPLSILLNELISNTMKHSFVGGKNGNLKIQASKTEDNKISILYSDDGIPIPDINPDEERKGFGLQLVNMLIKQLGGSIKLERLEQSSQYRIAFPL